MNNNTQRLRLTVVIKAMFLCLALGFIYVLMRSIGGPSNFSSPINLFDDVAIGQTAARRLGKDRVWVTRLSDRHRSQAQALASYIKDPDAGCNTKLDLCVLLATTARPGIDIIYSEAAPAQLPARLPWHGGFVDPTSGEVFDRLGRVYSATYKHNSTADAGRTHLKIAQQSE